ncbi:hypothetical protein E1263_41485 [Kribbella antibiotica]|uniref:PH domain-containing protein n=1 Tax=Kribbella antibiotica TaxID=190195 RepID=A0A4R4YG42_9ACTN|nr:hypothetical protein [Kribbella antibiotica]TDD43676.1 hypothetical protein E1263_41485 [Kribbella antibiotica]
MPIMGEASAEVWAAEYQRTSRVEFTRRTAPYQREMLLLQGLTAVSILLLAFVVPSDSDAWLLLIVVMLVTFGRSIWAAAQLVGNKLLLLVDANGIRYGDTRLAWNQIGTIGIPHKTTLAIVSLDGKPLTIRHWAVRDMSALGGWLEDVLKQHRATFEGESHADNG